MTGGPTEPSGLTGPTGPALSIVVPARNEAENLPLLAERIRAALCGWDYELVIVDDGSTDGTAEVAAALGHPVVVHRRAGPAGKGYALVDGFARSGGRIVCMIDADLQYPPEAIPVMAETVRSGAADLVVANRVRHDTRRVRRALSRVSYLVIQGLHGLNLDVQSGLKVIHRTVLDHVPLHPTGWALDLELLLRARAAGFVLAEHDIAFGRRQRGETKIRLGGASWQVLRNAVELKLVRPCPAPGRRPPADRRGARCRS
ncbi:glycosyltransferase [Actinophytocola sp.]|uniref:glycosyltransferase n=1 Tax=Actinophytocola sp. TaxID=1872138 RepID=UPI002ED9C437